MQLNTQLAEQIAAQAEVILNRRVLVADTTGLVLAGRDHRPGFSPEALQSAQTGHQIVADYEGVSTKWAPFVYDDATLAVFGLSLAAGPLTPEALSLIFGLADVLAYQYFLDNRLQSLETMRADFIREALTNPRMELDDLQRRADILQIDLRHPQAVILVRLKAVVEGQALLRLTEELREGLAASTQDLVTHLDPRTIIVIQELANPAPTTQNTIRFMTEQGKLVRSVLNNLQHSFNTIGIGQYYPKPDGLRQSYEDAHLALEVGRRVWGDGRLYHIKQVGMFITLADASHQRKAALAYQILSPLLNDEQLFKTVRAFLVTGLNLTAAAGELHIHRNTLIYRLDKTKKLIGLDPRQFDDALQIKLGLMFYRPLGSRLGA